MNRRTPIRKSLQNQITWVLFFSTWVTHKRREGPTQDKQPQEKPKINLLKAAQSQRSLKKVPMSALFHRLVKFLIQGNRMRNAVPLSIMDNIDTLRRGLMRELALRRLSQERRTMVKSSEDFKNSIGK